MPFLDSLRSKAQASPKRILFPEGNDPRILQAAIRLAEEHLAHPILLHPGHDADNAALSAKLKLLNIELVDSADLALQESYAQAFHELRKHKQITIEEARFKMGNPVYLAMMMLRDGKADGLVSGAYSSATKPLVPAFQIIGTTEEGGRASSYFVMLPPCHPHGGGDPETNKKDSSPEFQIQNSDPLFFADCAITIEPTAEELATIAIQTADSAQALGIEPRMAMLSFSTYGSAKHALVDKVRTAREIVNAKRPDIVCAGEIQFDAAFLPEVAKSKAPTSPIQGDANVFIFPDLQSGNIAYKVAERLGGFQAIGPILQGLKKPVNDLSRGCSVEDIVNVALLT